MTTKAKTTKATGTGTGVKTKHEPNLVTMQKNSCQSDVSPKAVASYKKAGWVEVEAPAQK
jgi:hypothetical protein